MFLSLALETLRTTRDTVLARTYLYSAFREALSQRERMKILTALRWIKVMEGR